MSLRENGLTSLFKEVRVFKDFGGVLQHLDLEAQQRYLFIWRQIWRVAGRESGCPELLGSPRTSPEVSRTSPESFRRLPRKFSHYGTYQQSRGSPEVPQTSPEVPRLPRRSAPFSGRPDTLSRLTKTFSDSYRAMFVAIASLTFIVLVFVGVSHTCRAICCKMGYRTDVPVRN